MSAYRLINPPIVRLLHSPMHRALSARIMTVSYQGRKSGKSYRIPVSYYRDGDTVYCFTNGSWRYSFTDKAGAVLRLGGKDYNAIGMMDTGDRHHQIATMSRYFKAVPQDKKFYGVRCDTRGEPIRAQVEQATHVVDILRFELQAPQSE